MDMGKTWLPLSTEGLEKVRKVLVGFEVELAKKFGRKTIFLHDSGVLRLYAIGGGKIWSVKCYTVDDAEVQGRLLALWACNADIMKPEELEIYRRSSKALFGSVYYNGEAGAKKE